MLTEYKVKHKDDLSVDFHTHPDSILKIKLKGPKDEIALIQAALEKVIHELT